MRVGANVWGLEGWLRAAAWSGAGVLLLTAAAAERLQPEMGWTAFDFGLLAGLLLAGCGLVELVLRTSRSWTYRAGAVITAGTMGAVFLSAGAVGIVGGEDHPANLLYAGVLALGLGGAFAAELKPRGMARTALLMAVATGLIGGLTVARGWGAGEAANWLPVAVLANGVFAGAWLLAAALFRRAEREGA